jgi:hypothetical protein
VYSARRSDPRHLFLLCCALALVAIAAVAIVWGHGQPKPSERAAEPHAAEHRR